MQEPNDERKAIRNEGTSLSTVLNNSVDDVRKNALFNIFTVGQRAYSPSRSGSGSVSKGRPDMAAGLKFRAGNRHY